MHRIINSSRQLVSKCLKETNTTQLPAIRAASSVAKQSESRGIVPQTRLSLLDNRMRVSSEDSGGPTATVGVWIDTGSRYETKANNGVAHFLEHMAFKGTNKRTQTDLELEIENMGAHLNAYTSREQTVYYAKCFKEDVPRAVEILSDIIQNCKLGEDEIERERRVILREMEEVEGNMQEVVFDHLHTIAFQGTPLANTILGPTKNVMSLTKADLQSYISNHYSTDRMVLAGAGGVNHEELAALADKHFKKTVSNEVGFPEYCRYTGCEMRVREDSMPAAHIALAVKSCGWSDPDCLPLMIATNIIGQWDRTSGSGSSTGVGLAQHCAEYNLLHSYMSFHTCYRDTGLWGIYYVADPMKIWEASPIIQHHWMTLCETITDFEVTRAKNQLRTQMLLNLDNTTQVCEEIGRSVLVYGRRIPFSEIDARLQAIDADVMKYVCSKYLYDKCPVQVGVGPIEAMTDYSVLRNRMYWLRV